MNSVSDSTLHNMFMQNEKLQNGSTIETVGRRKPVNPKRVKVETLTPEGGESFKLDHHLAQYPELSPLFADNILSRLTALEAGQLQILANQTLILQQQQEILHRLGGSDDLLATSVTPRNTTATITTTTATATVTTSPNAHPADMIVAAAKMDRPKCLKSLTTIKKRSSSPKAALASNRTTETDEDLDAVVEASSLDQNESQSYNSAPYLSDEVLDTIAQSAISRTHLATRLVKAIFRDVTEVAGKNVRGLRNKPAMDRKRIDWIRRTVYFKFPPLSGESEEKNWQQCIQNIDALARRIERDIYLGRAYSYNDRIHSLVLERKDELKDDFVL